MNTGKVLSLLLVGIKDPIFRKHLKILVVNKLGKIITFSGMVLVCLVLLVTPSSFFFQINYFLTTKLYFQKKLGICILFINNSKSIKCVMRFFSLFCSPSLNCTIACSIVPFVKAPNVSSLISDNLLLLICYLSF